jgi:hypothetical protein
VPRVTGKIDRMADDRSTRDIIDGLIARWKNVGRWSNGTPTPTQTDIEKSVPDLIEVANRLDKRLQQLEAQS